MRFFSALCIFVCAGCATVFSGSTQKIHIKVMDSSTHAPLDGCACSVIDGAGGEYSVATNPGLVTVSRDGPLSVRCIKKGYKQLNIAVGDSFNAVSLVNVLFWPGFIVDALSGSYKKYPSHYVVTMEPIQ